MSSLPNSAGRGAKLAATAINTSIMSSSTAAITSTSTTPTRPPVMPSPNFDVTIASIGGLPSHRSATELEMAGSDLLTQAAPSNHPRTPPQGSRTGKNTVPMDLTNDVETNFRSDAEDGQRDNHRSYLRAAMSGVNHQEEEAVTRRRIIEENQRFETQRRAIEEQRRELEEQQKKMEYERKLGLLELERRELERERETQRKATEAAEHERIMRERLYTLPASMTTAPKTTETAGAKAKGKKKRNRKAITSSDESSSDGSDSSNSDDDTSDESDASNSSSESKGRKKKRKNKKHKASKQKGNSSQQLETEYYEKVVRVPDLAHSKSAEMRKWVLHVWAMAKMIEKEDRKGEKADFRAVACFGKRMGEEIIASLDEFWKQPPTMDTATKIDRIVSRVVDFCNKHNSQIGTRAREWLPVPGAGNTSNFKPQNMMQQNMSMMPQQMGQMTAPMNTSYKPHWKQGNFKTTMQEKNEQSQQIPTQSPEQMAKEMKEAILKEMTQTLTQQFSQQQAAVNTQAMQPMQYRAPPTNFFPNANAQQLQPTTTPMQQQQQQAAAQLPTMNHQRMPMICFICQQPGHRQIHCPQMANARAAMAASASSATPAAQGATTSS